MRWLYLGVVLGCGTAPSPAASPASTEHVPRSGLRFDMSGWRTDFSRHTVPLEEIRSGGPPRDGIAPVDSPRFVSADEASEWLGLREPVIVVSLDGHWRAYPLQILVWHEVVNDTLAGQPITVTFCPLCYAAIVFSREVDGRVLTFGTTGNLRGSDLLLWDRQTETWWQQMTGKGIVGELTGSELHQEPSQIVSFGQLRAAHPEVEVLSRDTGFSRAYGRNPYGGYDDIDQRPFLLDGAMPSGPPPMTRVVGVRVGAATYSIGLAQLRRERRVETTIADVPAVVLWTPGVASALSADRVGDGHDIGATGAFDRRVDERTLSFSAHAGGFVDNETGSRWDVLGRALSGPLEGRELRPLLHYDTWWFVWATFVGGSPPAHQ